MEVVRNSFKTKTIELGRDNFEVRRGQSPQEKGKEIHKNLATCINNKIRDYSAEDRLLKKIEKEFRCKFLQAEVSIYGYCTKESEVDFYGGKMDAVATRRIEDHLEVLVVEWKSFSKKDPNKWWNNATNFKKPLYQCLIYRELLQALFKENDITARVGVMLVPIPRKRKPKVMPGLCTDFQRMDDEGLLNRIKKYEWFGVQSKYSRVCTITSPSNLLNLENLGCTYVEEGTSVLKRNKKVKKIIKDEATVGDLCQELGILQLKVRDEMHDERVQVEDEDAESSDSGSGGTSSSSSSKSDK